MNQSRYKEFIKMIRTIQNANERRIAELYLNELDVLRQQISKMYEEYGEDGSVRLEAVEIWLFEVIRGCICRTY